MLNENVVLNGLTTVADVNKCKMYMKNFGEFFNNQIEEAKCIVLSHTANASEHKIEECVALLREKNPHATIITTDWDKLSGEQILSAIENSNTLNDVIEEMKHHHHEHDEHCDCHEHEDHHHHEHDEHCDCHEHEHHHHHEHDEHCDCGCHDHHHHHHHHHHADEVFDSWGVETAKKYSENDIINALKSFENEENGIILRAKGIVDSSDGDWIYFDYIPGTIDIRRGAPDVIGKLCVIGSKLNEENIKKIFNV